MNNLDSTLYKFYLFCLPLGQLFRFLSEDGPMWWQFSTIVMVFGLMRIVLTRPTITNDGIRAFARIYIFMAIYTLIVSTILSFSINTGLIASPLRRCLGDVVFYFLALCSIYYNYYGLSKLISLSELMKLFQLQLIVLLLVGILQLGTLFGAGIGIYSMLSSIFALKDATYLSTLDRGITFFGSEPAASSLICFLVMPFLLFSMTSKKGFVRFGYILVFIVMSLIFLLSNSSSALLSFVAVIIAYLLLYVFKIRIKKLLMVSSFSFGLFVAILYSLDISTNNVYESDKDSFGYVLVGKIQDRDNHSTAMRASTVINDMKIFYDYPITGVGDGNQGYFYRDNMPMWVLGSEEVQSLMHGNKIANGGGNFFPAFISAYGIIGIVILFMFIKGYYQSSHKSIINQYPMFQMIYTLGIFLFLLSGWYVTGIKLNETICFLLSLPCVQRIREY